MKRCSRARQDRTLGLQCMILSSLVLLLSLVLTRIHAQIEAGLT